MMMMNDRTPDILIPLSDWKVESFRTTCFFSPMAEIIDFESWWEVATGNPPDNVISQPKKKEKRAEGLYEENWLTLRLQPIRADWKYGLQQKVPFTIEDGPTLGNYPDVVNDFLSPIKQWIGSDYYPKMRRLAFGVELLHPVDNLIDGQINLDRLIPSITLATENTSDFLFRINRKKTLSGFDFSINRLSTWSVITFNMKLVQIRADGSLIPEPGQDEEHSYIKLQLDINSEDDYYGEFEGEQSLVIIDQLVAQAEEIALKGDIP